MPFKITKRREVFRGKVFTLTTKSCILPNGVKTELNIIEHPGAAAIVPVFENGDVMLIKQFRLAAGGTIYEIPAGTLEKGESPLKCAKREIQEEIGYRAAKFVKLGEFFSAPGFCTEKMHLFLATGLTKTSSHTADKDECISPIRLPFKKAYEMALNGKIKDAKSITGICLAQRKLYNG